MEIVRTDLLVYAVFDDGWRDERDAFVRQVEAATAADAAKQAGGCVRRLAAEPGSLPG